MPEFNLRHYR